MTERQYKELLHTLGINAGKSSVDTKELLEAKLSEYLDRTDAEAEQKVSDIQDALDYVEDLIDKMGGGIALAPEDGGKNAKTDEANQKVLGQAAKKNKKEAVTYTSSADTSGQNASAGTSATQGVNPKGKAWYYSLYGDQRVEDMFEMAEGDLKQGDFNHAASVFDMLLKLEVANAGAYMGKVLAVHHLKNPKDIATCYDKGLENDPELRRAESVGNEKQKKFIRDALEERRKAMVYIEADKILQIRNNASELLRAATKFESLGSYRDSSQKADKCREASKQVQEAEKRRIEEEKKRQKEREEEKKRKEEQRKKELEEQKIKEQKELPKKAAKTILDIPNIIFAFIMAECWGWTWGRFIHYPIDVIVDVFTGLGVLGEIGNTTGVVSYVIGRIAPFIGCVVFNILLFRNNKKMRIILSKEKTLKETIIVTVLLIVAGIIIRTILYRLGLGRLMSPLYNMTYNM